MFPLLYDHVVLKLKSRAVRPVLKTVATRLKYQNVVRTCFAKRFTAQPVLRKGFTTCGCYVIARASELGSLQQTGGKLHRLGSLGARTGERMRLGPASALGRM